jgi:hypothetical protein
MKDLGIEGEHNRQRQTRNGSSLPSLPTEPAGTYTPACPIADPEAVERLRAFFRILAEWAEADQPNTESGEVMNQDEPRDSVGNSQADGVR